MGVSPTEHAGSECISWHLNKGLAWLYMGMGDNSGERE